MLVTKPHLDRAGSDRSPAGGPDRAHGERLQKYLRNEFATIEEYNTSCGRSGGAVPLAGHQRLSGEVQRDRGAAAGEHHHQRPAVRRVHPDDGGPVAPLPQNFGLADLRRAPAGAELVDVSRGGRGGVSSRTAEIRGRLAGASLIQVRRIVECPGFGDRLDRLARRSPLAAPLLPDAPPPPEQFTSSSSGWPKRRRTRGGWRSRSTASPPKLSSCGRKDSRREHRIPAGPCRGDQASASAAGQGTSQHMLIAGKTGSGKSTFLHCLITNLALHYSPDEVRF